MTATEANRRRLAEAHAAAAYRSVEVAEAYAALAGLVATDDRFAAIREMEIDRLWAQSTEYADDAEHEREQAISWGYQPT